MALPNATLRPYTPKGPGGVAGLWATVTGVIDNGINTFGIPFIDAGIDFDVVDPDYMIIDVQDAGPGLTGLSAIAPFLSPDRRQIIGLDADGSDTVTLIISLTHTENIG